MNKDLTATQNDYARFLPALSGFYATYVGKQRYDEYVDKSRIPSNFANGVESLNYLNKQEGAFQYQWTLYSAGHAELDTNKHAPKEDMVRNRDRDNSWILAGRILTVLKHKRKENKFSVGWMLIWTMV